MKGKKKPGKEGHRKWERRNLWTRGKKQNLEEYWQKSSRQSMVIFHTSIRLLDIIWYNNGLFPLLDSDSDSDSKPYGYIVLCRTCFHWLRFRFGSFSHKYLWYLCPNPSPAMEISRKRWKVEEWIMTKIMIADKCTEIGNTRKKYKLNGLCRFINVLDSQRWYR